jgi:hypothetical protein
MSLHRTTFRTASRHGAAVLLLLATVGRPASVRAQDQSAQVVDVILNHSASVPLISASHILVVDDSICRAEVENGIVRLFGLKRGETVVVVWRNEDTPESLLVRVAAPPPPKSEKTATVEELDAMGHGTVASMAHVGTTSRGARSVSMLTPFVWTEGTAGRRFTMNGQMQGTRAADASTFSLDTLSAQWIRGATTVQALDFVVNLDGGAPARMTPSSPAGAVALRGVDAVVSRGKNSYELFGGTSLPWFAASRQLAGVNVSRQASSHLYIDSSTAVVRVPVLVDGIAAGRHVSVFQTVGVADRLSDRAAVQLRGGAGTSGYYGQASGAWEGDRASAFVTATGSSPQFGLNQLQLVYAPNVAVQSAANWNITHRLRTGLGYSHTATQSTPLFPASSTSDYVSSTLSASLTQHHTVFANTTWNRNIGGLGMVGELTGRRVDAGVSSQFGRRIANNVQLSAGALADPLQLNSRSQFTFRDSATIAIRGGSLNVSFSHDRLSPSLVARLQQQVNLLAVSLQPLFLDDPVGFVDSPLMPSDVRELLTSLEPIDTQAVVSGQFRLGPRLTVSPTLSYLHHAQSASLKTSNEMLGYSLTWRATPTLEIQSTLSNVLVFDPRQADLARTTIFGVGIRKTLNGAPRWIAPSAGYQIRGRVFRDQNIDGVGDAAETGLPGVTIRLNDGRTTRTDVHGRYEFGGLAPGEYRLVMPLDQFDAGMRVTTPVDAELRLYERRVVDVDFGVVNFSRLLGTVFNDYAMNGVRQADAPGLRDTELIIEGSGIERRIVTDGAGEFEIDDLVPGRYRISIDTASIPPNYEPVNAWVDVEVAPSSTTVVSVPVRALRSIGGHVYLKAAGPHAAPVPLKGVQVVAHTATAVTDEEGRFVLRNLPAGEVTVSLVPIAGLPAGVAAPAGRLRMPTGPTQLENAMIVIDNPILIEYLVPAAVRAAMGSR